jgi:hypothetical protein
MRYAVEIMHLYPLFATYTVLTQNIVVKNVAICGTSIMHSVLLSSNIRVVVYEIYNSLFALATQGQITVHT